MYKANKKDAENMSPDCTHHIHENISDHNHGRLVVIPARVESVQKVVVQRFYDIFTNLQKIKYTTLIRFMLHRICATDYSNVLCVQDDLPLQL